MQESFQFIGLDSERVFVASHAPTQRPSRALIICHPLGEEKLWAHRVLVSFARHLASAGYLAVRFDFRGEGDSERQFQEADLESRVEDTRRVVEATMEMNPNIEEISLLGLRLGATVATAASAYSKMVSRLVLWDPIVDGAAYMQTVLRWNLMFQMAQHKQIQEDRAALVARLENGGTVNVEGYELGGSLYRQVGEFRFDGALAAFPGSKLMLQVVQGEVAEDSGLRDLAGRVQRCAFDRVTEGPFWRETKSFYQRSESLTLATMNWLAADEE